VYLGRKVTGLDGIQTTTHTKYGECLLTFCVAIQFRIQNNYISYLRYMGTALQAGRSRVRFPIVSLEFFIDIILPAALWTWGSTQPLTEMSTRNISWG